MKARRSTLFLCCAVLSMALNGSSHAAAPTPINDPVEGQKLARELRAMTPAENTTFDAELKIKAGDTQRVVRIQTTSKNQRVLRDRGSGAIDELQQEDTSYQSEYDGIVPQIWRGVRLEAASTMRLIF